MKIQSIYDESFKKYGKIIDYPFNKTLEILKTKPCLDRIIYRASDEELENTEEFDFVCKNMFGYMPIQFGYCSGHNKSVYCLEYHKCSEINIANEDFILVLGKIEDIVDGNYDSKNLEAFLVPSKIAVEIYSTTLHFAPCHMKQGFIMLVALIKGTNVGNVNSSFDSMLYATNKWLLAREDSYEAKNKNAHIGLIGDLIRIE